MCNIVQLLLLKKFADGFSYQKRVIFGFGEHKDDDTKSVLKIKNFSKAELKTLDGVQIHNLAVLQGSLPREKCWAHKL